MIEEAPPPAIRAGTDPVAAKYGAVSRPRLARGGTVTGRVEAAALDSATVFARTHDRPCVGPLETEADPGVAREPLQVRNAGEDDRRAAVIGVELVRSLGAGRQRVLERIGARRRDVGGDDRATGEGDLDADGIR